jgi:hypothetical protein
MAKSGPVTGVKEFIVEGEGPIFCFNCDLEIFNLFRFEFSEVNLRVVKFGLGYPMIVHHAELAPDIFYVWHISVRGGPWWGGSACRDSACGVCFSIFGEIFLKLVFC